MSIYNVNGSAINSLYDESGTQINNAYDVNGNQISSGGSGTDYHSTILLAKNAWKSEYKADADIVPLILTTDQHGYMNASYGKALYDYLAQIIDWVDVSASLNLGDTCAGKYNTSELENMLLALSNIPAAKQINMMGNHDVWYGDSTIDDSTFTTAQSTYFNNSSFNGNVRFENRGNEIMIDAVHGIKYICVACWYFPDGTYYHYTYPEDAMDWLLTQLSANDGYDIIVLSHIQPLATNRLWYKPAVDGGTESSSTVARNYSGVAPYGAKGLFEGLLSARKNKASGTITDSDGITHSYDFSGCTSDILCWLAGHAHTDAYAYDGGNVPVIIFDAYRYDNHPFFFINVDRTQEQINVWKVDDSPAFYNYQIPFEESAL